MLAFSRIIHPVRQNMVNAYICICDRNASSRARYKRSLRNMEEKRAARIAEKVDRENSEMMHESLDYNEDILPVESVNMEHIQERISFEEKNIQQSRYQRITKTKPRNSEPQLLTWKAQEQIRHLFHEEDWSMEEIAESFPITMDGIKRILKSKRKLLTTESIDQHDRRVLNTWKRISGQVSSKEFNVSHIEDPNLKWIIDKKKLELLHCADGNSNLPMPLTKDIVSEENKLDLYKFPIISKDKKPVDKNVEHYFEDGDVGPFTRLYKICCPTSHQQKQDNKSEKEVHKEIEKIKLIQALIRKKHSQDVNTENQE